MDWLEQLHAEMPAAPRKTRQRMTAEQAQTALTNALLTGLQLTNADLTIWETLSVRDYAASIERFLYDQLCTRAPLFNAPHDAYCARLRLLVSSLKRSAPYLVQYEPTFVASASADQLGAGTLALRERELHWEELRKLGEAAKAERQRLLSSDFVGLYCCPRCKSWKTTYYLLQTRSADEPMTAFVECLLCSQRFRR
jgi:hypothetical protein